MRTLRIVAVAVSVWYHGVPAGVPRQDDLDAIRRAGFTAVTWPLRAIDHVVELRRMAAAAGLAVVIRDPGVPLSWPLAAQPQPERVDIGTANLAPAAARALAWRAIAHGARVISFDAGTREGSGLRGAGGQLAPWAAPAMSVAREVSMHDNLVAVLEPGPLVTVDAAPAVDVVLLDAGKSWTVIATNASAATAHMVAHLPPGVPSAEWTDVLTGTPLAMVSQPGQPPRGPRWTTDLGPWDVRVCVIGKIAR